MGLRPLFLARIRNSRWFCKVVVRRISGMLVLSVAALATSGTSQFGTKGIWTEACSCSVPCQCLRTGKANVPKCVTIEVYYFDSGIYEGHRVGPATAALLGVAKTRYQAPGPDILYISDSADQQTIDAVKGVFSCMYGMLPHSGIRRSHLTVQTSPTRRIVEIPGTLYLEAMALKHSGAIATGGTLMYPWLANIEQWQAVRFKMRTDSAQFNFSRTNSLSGSLVSSQSKAQDDLCGVQ